MIMDDLRIESRFKNQRLWEIIELFFRSKQEKPYYGLVRIAAKDIGINECVLGLFLNLRRNPRSSKTDMLVPSAKKIVAFFGADPEELFPRTLYALELPARAIRILSSPEILSLQEAERLKLLPAISSMEVEENVCALERRDAIRAILKTLSPREEMILRMRFGLEDCDEWTLKEVGQRFGVSVGRVLQIEARALRRLRHPFYRGTLLAHMEQR